MAAGITPAAPTAIKKQQRYTIKMWINKNVNILLRVLYLATVSNVEHARFACLCQGHPGKKGTIQNC